MTAPPSPPGPDWRPRLKRAIVLRHDPVRDQELLVMPERIVVLNDEAAAVVRLCDGERTVGDIVTELSGTWPADAVADDVSGFLARIRDEGWVG
ncbi:pyrroloquinoline quinone biosynthesis peptide chaperone PqqD [Spongiactinospora rosea]|uniref:Pyrroloquinoline quinone biosynthesis peptide chaperone PqqD n=1 Tax=Spongiactinospora rosea TaxID=2248750 RepID=A0A366M1K6_9ACTN|nr:pyrroloquinoline quinone biosynthesis peptide chaperone PqqD [Spongiactinospora rosea]RBQ19670.1 pyrroloquinoline quinone biosynthesis peptide chaperone PqqD [Spongiactinospora rosea]